MEGVLYRLTFPNGKVYIGITCDFERRMAEHSALSSFRMLVCRAIAKVGWDNIKREILVVGPYSYITQLEPAAIIVFNSRVPTGYNVTAGGEGVVGFTHSDETRAKLSAANKGKPSRNKGRTHSAESRKNMSLAHVGQTHSEEARKKISQAGVGRKRTPESIEATRKAHIGRKHTDEAREKIRAARARQTITPEAIEKTRLFNLGRPLSEEHKAKIGAANRKARQKKADATCL